MFCLLFLLFTKTYFNEAVFFSSNFKHWRSYYKPRHFFVIIFTYILLSVNWTSFFEVHVLHTLLPRFDHKNGVCEFLQLSVILVHIIKCHWIPLNTYWYWDKFKHSYFFFRKYKILLTILGRQLSFSLISRSRVTMKTKLGLVHLLEHTLFFPIL